MQSHATNGGQGRGPGAIDLRDDVGSDLGRLLDFKLGTRLVADLADVTRPPALSEPYELAHLLHSLGALVGEYHELLVGSGIPPVHAGQMAQVVHDRLAQSLLGG